MVEGYEMKLEQYKAFLRCKETLCWYEITKKEAEQLNALIIDCEKDELIKHLMEKPRSYYYRWTDNIAYVLGSRWHVWRM